MPNKLYKILLILGIVAIFISIPVFWYLYNPTPQLEVDFLDVGQGDAILIKTPFEQNILIDGGPDNTVIKRLSEELPWWDRQIDLMVLTHPHDDHVSGLIEVIKRYKVVRILYTGVVHNSPNYLAWLELLRDRKIPLTIIDRQQTINFGQDCELEILYPQENVLNQTVQNLNNTSIVAKLIYGQTSFLLTGDAEVEVEHLLVETQHFASLQADVLKAGHHGSDTSSSAEFLEAVKAGMAIIQAGADNDFGHPSRRVIKRFERIGAQIFRNDEDGTIKLISDGVKITAKD